MTSALIEALETRCLLSATADIPNLSIDQGLLLPSGRRLLDNDYNSVIAINADGTLDSTFGTNGAASVPGVMLGGARQGIYVSPFAVADDGDILVAGFVSGGGSVVAFHPDGSLDTSFADGGVASIQMGTDSGFFALSVQADGKIVAVGESFVQNVGEFAAARFNSNGSPDAQFNGSGLINVALQDKDGFLSSDLADAIAIEADGGILVGGTVTSTSPTTASGAAQTDPQSAFGLIRLNTDGTLDEQFGADGKTVTHFGSTTGGLAALLPASMNSLLVRNDGEILAVGTGTNHQISVALFKADGSLDINYGIGGRVLINATSGRPENVRLTSDGGLEVLGLNDESFVWSKVDASGHWLEGPVTAADPTPPPAFQSASDITATQPSLYDRSDDAPLPDPTSSEPVVISLVTDTQPAQITLPAPMPPAIATETLIATFTTVTGTGTSAALVGGHATIDWGDGSTPNDGMIEPVLKHAALTGVVGGHQYANSGFYKIHVTLTADSFVRVLTRTVHVKARTSNGRAIHVPVSQPFTQVVGRISAAALSSIGNGVTLDIQIDWGDGSDLSDGTLTKRRHGYVILGTHTYQQAGHYEVAAMVSNVFFEQPSNAGTLSVSSVTSA
ncbi:MAG TPA: hypothetical protein VH370_01435 [Humisphaera sp.]|jgi:uncharacterized delta-60 repeat protein|nr:hypothetical protein [Humisphaera sp.]